MKNNIHEIDKKQLEQVTGGAGALKRPMRPIKPGRNQNPIEETNRRMRREYLEQLQEQNMQQESVAEAEAQ